MRETYPVPSVHGGGGLDRIAIELVQCSDGPERPVRAPKFLAKSDSGRALTDGRLLQILAILISIVAARLTDRSNPTRSQIHSGTCRPAHGKDTQTLTPSRTPHSSPPPGDRQRRAAAGQVGHTHELALTLAPAPSAVCAESHRTPHVPHGDRYPTVAALMVSGLPTPGAHGQPSHSFISRLTSRERDADTHYTCLAPASHAPTHSLSLAVLSPRAHAPLTRHTHDVCSAGDDSGVEFARGRVERRGALLACPPALW